MSKNKKIILLLLLFIVVGFVGYGTYSYYSTTKEFGSEYGEKNTIYVNKVFNPMFKNAQYNHYDFLSYSADYAFNVSCTKTDNMLKFYCVTSIEIINDGSDAVIIYPSNAYAWSDSFEIDENLSYVEADCISKMIEPGETGFINLSGYVYFKSGLENEEVEYADYSVAYDSTPLYIRINLMAEQYH